MQKWSYNIIGTHLAIALDTEEDCSQIFHDIETRLQDFEKKFSRFIEGNWLHTLNTSRHAILDEDAQKMLLYALDIARKTDGYFDPTVGKRLTELGYGNQVINDELGMIHSEKSVSVIPARPLRSETKLGSTLGVKAGIHASNKGDYRDIEIVGDEVILHGDILLEFGGVGKGYLIDVIKYIIDRSFRDAEEGGIQDMDSSCRQNDGSTIKIRYLINFGGDMYGCGGWRVGLESPFAPDEVIGTYILDDGFLACSAGTRRKWGDNKHHLIDPKTGTPAREIVASYIEGGSGISVDSYATALCVMPWDRAIAILQKTPDISGVIVRHDGILYQKEGSSMRVFE